MVRSMGFNLKNFPISARRVAAMVVAIGCHVFLLIVLLRPASSFGSTDAIVENKATLLELRFIARPLMTSPTSQSPSRVARKLERHVAEPNALASKRTRTPNSVPTSEVAADPSAASGAPPALGLADRPVISEPHAGDGGFRDRLLNAQHSQGSRGIPGSDTHISPGIQLTDPMNQGVGAVMRDTQRLFGITNRHCIDVEVWQGLSAGELSARHLSPADVRREGEKYNCNRPLGLNF